MTNEMNPLFAKNVIRIDTHTQQASVIDVVKMVTAKDTKHASKYIERLPIELRQRFNHTKINNKGKKTWCADASTCVEVIFELPGKAAKEFSRQSAHYICRILGGDRTLIEETETRFERTGDSLLQFFINSSTKRPILPARTDVEESRIRQRKLEDLEITERESRILQSQLDAQQAQLTLQRSRVEQQLYLKSILGNDAEVVAIIDENIKQLEANGSIPSRNINTGITERSSPFLSGPTRDFHERKAELDAALDDNIKQLAFNRSVISSLAERKSPFLPDLTQIVHEISGKVVPTHQLSKIGRAVSAAYQSLHGCATPHKVERFCNGVSRKVNAYSTDDKDLVYGVVASFLK